MTQKQESGKNNPKSLNSRVTGATTMNAMYRKSLLLAVLMAASLLMSAPAEAQTVRTESGLVRGITEGDVSVFKGIPYAAPPVGDYRWRPPQPVASWDGVRDAGEFGPGCAAGGWGAAPGTIREGSSEDCLYLNVWMPSGAEPGAALPVMVWIHGGGFTGGSGSIPQEDGYPFASKGVMLITLNYRLGRLGHFAFPALSKEHSEEPKGSYAFMDQIAALKWIQENIEAFGGDPGNVTIFGFSAGGVSVHSLMTIPDARGLFHKVTQVVTYSPVVML